MQVRSKEQFRTGHKLFKLSWSSACSHSSRWLLYTSSWQADRHTDPGCLNRSSASNQWERMLPPPPGHFPSAIHLEQWWVRGSKCALINNLECIQRKTHNNESDQKYVKRGIVEAIQMEKERQRWDICLEVLGSHYIFMETDLACRSLEHRTPMSGRNLPGRQFGSIERKTPAIQSYPMLREAGLRSLEGLRVWI